MKTLSTALFALALAGAAYAQNSFNPPSVVLETGTITGQNSFIPDNWNGYNTQLYEGQANSGDGVFFGDYYWVAIPTINFNDNKNNISLFPISGIGQPSADMPAQYTVVPMNPDGNGDALFTPYNRVELVSWAEQLWVISFTPGSAEVQFAPLSYNPDYDSGNPRAQPYFATNPTQSSNFIVTGNRPILGLSAELVDDQLVIFTWHGTHLDGYTLGVTTSTGGDFFGETHYISLGEELNYTGLFDTQVYIPNASAALPGVTAGVANVLIVAASENIGTGGNQDLLMWSATLEELTSETDFPVTEVPFLSKTGLFTEEPFTAYTLKLCDGAVDFKNGQLFGNPSITIAILGQVPAGPHYPWFIATAPIMTSFNAETDADAIPAFTYSSQGSSPNFEPWLSFSLGTQPVPVLDSGGNPTGDVQNYAMFTTAMTWGPSYEPYLSYSFVFQAAKANYLEQQPVVVTKTDELGSFAEEFQTAIIEAWSLIGVIHGAPPVAFNGSFYNQTSTTITWSEASSATKEASLTHTSKTSVSEQASGTTPFFNAKVESSQTFLHAIKMDTSSSATLTLTESTTLESVSRSDGGKVNNTGKLIFLAPAVNNQAYRAYSFRGNDLDQITYVTWISGATLVDVTYDMTSPETAVEVLDVDEGQARFNVSSGMAATPSQDMPNQWVVAPAWSSDAQAFSIQPGKTVDTSEQEFTVAYASSSGNSTTSTSSQTIGGGASIEIGYGYSDADKQPWGFHVGSSVDRETTKTFVLESETSGQFNESIVTVLDPIIVPTDPPANSYSSVTITPYLYFPNEPGEGDWIPTGRSAQQPFLITWAAAAAPVNPSDDNLSYTEYWGANYKSDVDDDIIYVPFMQRWLYNGNFPWVYDFPNDDWRYFPRLLQPGGGMFVYSIEIGWLWTRDDIVPWYYRLDNDSWTVDQTSL